MCVCVCACSQHLQATPGQSAAAAAKAAADKVAAAAADKAAAAKAQQEADDAQLATALAVSLAVSGPVQPPPPPSLAARVKRWGDGLEAPAATKKQMATLEFVNVLPGRKLSGSLFVIDSITAKDIRHFSTIPSEEEVLFPPNSQFKVEKVVTSEQEKKALLDQLGAYNMADLDVYVLKQMA